MCDEIPIFTNYAGIFFSNRWPTSLRANSYARDFCQPNEIFFVKKGGDGHIGPNSVIGCAHGSGGGQTRTGSKRGLQQALH
jgi:hypothetical protein